MEYSSTKGHNNVSSKGNKVREYICFVPMCPSHSATHPHKLFLTGPQNPTMRAKWLEAVQSDDRFSPKTVIRCCEDHFDMEKDVENWVKFRLVGGRLFLKKDVVPHFFECQNRLLKPTPIMIYKEKILKDIEMQCNANSEPTDTQRSDHSYASKPHNDHNYCQPVHLRDTIETDASEDIPEEEVFSWQKKDSVETGQDSSDDSEDRMPAPVPEKPIVCEDVMTLSMDCDEPEPPSAPSEPAAEVSENVEDRCKDCEAVVDGFQFYCISCGRGALCGACAACAPHDDHYLLRAPKDVTKDQTEAVLEAIRQQMLKKDLLTLYGTDENGVKVEIKNEPEEPPSSLPEPTEPDPPVLPDPLDTETKTQSPSVQPSMNESTETIENSMEPLARYEEMLSGLPVFAEPLDKKSHEALAEEHSDDSMTDLMSESQIENTMEEALENTKEDILEEPGSEEPLSEMVHNLDSESDEEETVEHHPRKRPRLVARHKKQNSRGNETVQQQSLELNSNVADGSVVISHSDPEGLQTVLQLNSSDLRELQSVLHLNSNDLKELQSVLQASSSDLTESQTVLQISPSDFRELQTVLQQSNSSNELTESQNVLEVSPNEFEKLQSFLQTSPSDLTESQFILQPNPSGLTESQTVLQVSPSEFTKLQNLLEASPSNLTESQTVLLSPNDVQELQTVLQMSTSDHTKSQTILQVSPNKFTRLQNLLQASPSDLTESETVLQIGPSDLKEFQTVQQPSPSNNTESPTVIQINPNEFAKLHTLLQTSPNNLAEQQTVLQISPTEFIKLQKLLHASPSNLTKQHTHIGPSDLKQFAQVTPNLTESGTVLQPIQVSAGDLTESQTVLQISPSDFRELETLLQVSPNITELENVQVNSSKLTEAKTIQIMQPFRKKSRNGPSKPTFLREL